MLLSLATYLSADTCVVFARNSANSCSNTCNTSTAPQPAKKKHLDALRANDSIDARQRNLTPRPSPDSWY